MKPIGWINFGLTLLLYIFIWNLLDAIFVMLKLTNKQLIIVYSLGTILIAVAIVLNRNFK